MWTVSGLAQDSIKFSVTESKVLISAWKNQPRYKEIIDSCESEATQYRFIIKNDSIENRACERVNETQNLLIGAHQEQTKDLKAEIKRSDRRTKIIAGAAFLEFLVIVYQIIKP